jgi:hypothetical protein
MNCDSLKCHQAMAFPLDVDPFYDGSVPRLDEVLRGSSAVPWTLESFTRFVGNNYCSEVLDFTTDAMNYRLEYDRRVASAQQGKQLVVGDLLQRWGTMMEMYIAHNAPREINIPGDVRLALLSHMAKGVPPPPDLLNTAFGLMLELMHGIYMAWQETSTPATAPSTPLSALQTSENHKFRTSSGIVDGTYQSCSSPPPTDLPFYKRAHTLLGSSRVYRKIRKTSICGVESVSEGQQPMPKKRRWV